MNTIIHDNGFEKVNLTSPDGAQAEVYLYGGHVTGWHPAGGVERLFLSKRAVFKSGTAIRGGVPVCFPQFNNEGPLIKHGFARIMPWKLDRITTSDTQARAELLLEDSPETRKLWPVSFSARLIVTIGGPSLRMELLVTNTGSSAFTFSGALHTYLHTEDINKVRVAGLKGQKYRNAVTGQSDLVQDEEELSIIGEVDRVYGSAPSRVTLKEPGRVITSTHEGFKDIVVWNPGPDKCKDLKDMEPEDYQKMLCVEAAIVNEPQEVPAGSVWRGMQELSLL